MGGGEDGDGETVRASGRSSQQFPILINAPLPSHAGPCSSTTRSLIPHFLTFPRSPPQSPVGPRAVPVLSEAGSVRLCHCAVRGAAVVHQVRRYC